MADDFQPGSRGSNRTAPACSTPNGNVTIARRPSHRRSSVTTCTPDRDRRTRRTRVRSSMRRPRASRCGTTSYPRGIRAIRSPSISAEARSCCAIAFTLAPYKEGATDRDWLAYRIKDDRFEGIGDPTKLQALLFAFLDLADRTLAGLGRAPQREKR